MNISCILEIYEVQCANLFFVKSLKIEGWIGMTRKQDICDVNIISRQSHYQQLTNYCVFKYKP